MQRVNLVKVKGNSSSLVLFLQKHNEVEKLFKPASTKKTEASGEALSHSSMYRKWKKMTVIH